MAFQQWEPLATKYDPLKIGSIDGTDVEPHDRAVVRALNAKYKPNKGVQGNPHATVFVGRLNSSTNEETLKGVFSQFGEVVNVRLVRDIVTGFSKRYAFVEYESKHSAVRAYQAHKMVIDQQEILVDFEHSRTMEGWVPRRLGGGFGGKRESGQLRFGCRDRPFSKPILLNKIDIRDKHEKGGGKQSYSPYRRPQQKPYAHSQQYRQDYRERSHRSESSDRESKRRR